MRWFFTRMHIEEYHSSVMVTFSRRDFWSHIISRRCENGVLRLDGGGGWMVFGFDQNRGFCSPHRSMETPANLFILEISLWFSEKLVLKEKFTGVCMQENVQLVRVQTCYCTYKFQATRQDLLHKVAGDDGLSLKENKYPSSVKCNLAKNRKNRQLEWVTGVKMSHVGHRQLRHVLPLSRLQRRQPSAMHSHRAEHL